MLVNLSCVVCPEVEVIEMAEPEGWAIHGGEVCADGQLCPKHALIDKFRDAQCPGCVSSFGEGCPLFKTFAYDHRTVTDADYLKLEAGRCPRRVNGTFMIGPEGAGELDLSDVAPDESGKAMAQAIREYIERYP